jgi:hypothetical protein
MTLAAVGTPLEVRQCDRCGAVGTEISIKYKGKFPAQTDNWRALEYVCRDKDRCKRIAHEFRFDTL